MNFENLANHYYTINVPYIFTKLASVLGKITTVRQQAK